MGLTDGILCGGASRRFARFAQPCHVDSSDSKLVLNSLCKTCNLQGPICHGLPVHLGPVQLLGLFLFQHVAQDGGLAIICRLFPAHSHIILGHVSNQWGLTRARYSWILKKDFKCEISNKMLTHCDKNLQIIKEYEIRQ